MARPGIREETRLQRFKRFLKSWQFKTNLTDRETGFALVVTDQLLCIMIWRFSAGFERR